LFQCPVCGELLEALTDVHCRSKHQISKQAFIAAYGVPKYLSPILNRDVQRWIRASQVITRMDFEMVQSAARNQYQKRI